ncbi:unnamed protein product [Sympodiomycopsis kandeliae]
MAMTPTPTGGLQLTPQERLAFAHLFSLADPSNSGIVPGHTAVSFFAKSSLPSATLGQIWSLADSTNNGFLTAPTFSIALRLIAHAQRGETPDEALVHKPTTPPAMQGVQYPNPSGFATPMSPQQTGASPSPAHATILPQDRARYTRLFASAGPSGGLVDGDRAKDILVKSKLPFEKLGHIWTLADTKSRGALDLTDFIIAMHLVQQSMNGSMQTIPASLPPGLYESASGQVSSPLRAQSTGTTPGAIPRQLTGQQPLSPTTTGSRQPLSPVQTGSRQQQPLSPSVTGTGAPAFSSPQQSSSFLSAQRTGLAAPPSFLQQQQQQQSWAISTEEKSAADKFFDALDTGKKGLLDGQTVVPFFMQSQLSEQALAHVWDLSDITQSGSLNRDEFAVAMHLIKSSLAGNQLPQELSADLVPPALRNQKLPEPVNPNQTETQKDLFSLMDDDDDDDNKPLASLPSSLPVSAAANAFGAPAPGAPVQQKSRATDAFDDDDFFSGGQASAPTATSASAVTSPAPAPPQSSTRGQLPVDESAEYGNKTLQLNSTQKSVDELQAKRKGLEASTAENTTTLSELTSRLATVKSTYDTESRLVSELTTRRDSQAQELSKLKNELISQESELSRLKFSKDEIEQSVLADREEILDTKKRMTIVSNEVTALKSQVEKLKKDSRQQKGLLAINKKQVSTAEGEKTKLQDEIHQLQSPTEEHLEKSTTEETVKSPAASVKSNNPFDRFQQNQSPASPHSQGANLAAAAGLGAVGVGAATATAAAVSAHHDSEHDNKDTTTAAQQDPWSTSTATAQPPSNTATFDDAFGDDFDEQPSATAPGVDAAAAQPTDSAGFDDAFGELDEPNVHNKEETTPAAAAVVADSAGFDDAFGELDESNVHNKEAGVAAPVADAPSDAGAAPSEHTQLGAVPAPLENPELEAPSGPSENPELEAVSAPLPSNPGVATGEAPITTTTRDADDITHPATADVPDAAEDIFNPTESSTAAGSVHDDSNLGADHADSDSSSDGEDEGPEDIEGGSGSAFKRREADAQPASQLASGTGVEDRFPELPSTEDVTPVTATTSASEDNDAFEDANTGSHPASGNDLPTSAAGNDLPIPGGFTTASEDVKQPSISPSNSVKVRRAPPPAPVRSPQSNVTALPGASSVASPQSVATALPGANVASPQSNTTALPGAGPATADIAQSAAQPPPTSFDDFEASFADLGVSNAANNTTTTTNNAAAGGGGDGFDDAFDDADFDFVPSFGGNQPTANAAAPTAPTAASTTAPTQGGNDNFANFDDAFADFSQPAQPSHPQPPPQTSAVRNTSSGGNNSESSAFSFEDAFAPPANVSLNDPFGTTTSATPATAAPPSLPSRSAAAPSQSLTTPTTDTGRSTSPALADDAGPVRQLASMGFARHEVIKALEKSNYNVSKALERLLAGQ